MLIEHDRIMEGNTVWFSLKRKINKKLQKYNPTIPTICSIFEVVETLILFITGLLPFVSLGYNIIGFPADNMDAERLHTIIKFPMPVCRLIAWAVGGRPARIFRFSSLNLHLRRRGMPIFLLGINGDSDIPSFALTHATACLTDRPKWLLSKKSLLKKKDSAVSPNLQ